MTLDILSVVMIGFILIELSNVVVLYCRPGSRRGNGMGVFKPYKKAQADPEVYALITYLINWVAGVKLIFIVLIGGIAVGGDRNLKAFSVGALILSIATFYIRLYPGIKKMDGQGLIEPKGYAKTLGLMIGGFILIFSAALAVYLTGPQEG